MSPAARTRRASGGGPWRGLVLLLAVAAGLWLAFGLRPGGAVRGYVAKEVVERRLARHAQHFTAAGAEFGVDPHVLAAMAWVESSGRATAESSAAALGLMQVQLPTAGDMARRLELEPPTREALLTDPALNVRLGAAYLAWLLPRQDGDLERALMAYNTGPGRFGRWLADAGGYDEWRASQDALGAPGPGSVRRYAARVLELAERLRASDALGLGTPAPRE